MIGSNQTFVPSLDDRPLHRSSQYDIAADYIAAGLSIFPVRLDGSKAPAAQHLPIGDNGKPSWHPYRERFATAEELDRWFVEPAGIAIVCGVQSGGLEVIDFDAWQLFEPWKASVDARLIARLPVVETGSGGFHVFYRCRQIAGNQKLAMREDAERLLRASRRIPAPVHSTFSFEHAGDGGPLTRIETRAEGGYVIGCGSPLEVHSSGAPYAQIAGPVLPEVPVITPVQRRDLWLAASSFDCAGRKSAKVKQRAKEIKRQRYEARHPQFTSHTFSETDPLYMALPGAGSGGAATVWDDFDERGSWIDILSAAGFVQLNGTDWSRPRNDGKCHTSCKVNTSTSGVEVLTCFSSSLPEGMSPEGGDAHKSVGKFTAYKILFHGGDGRAAARELAAKGYGGRPNHKQEAAA